jgi:hypothetical protein
MAQMLFIFPQYSSVGFNTIYSVAPVSVIRSRGGYAHKSCKQRCNA